MKAIILHESKGRIRFRISQKKMTLQEADVLENWFQKKSWVTQVTVHERTGCVILQYSGSRKEVLAAIREFNLQEAQSQITLPLHSSRELNRKFQEKLVGKVVLKAASMLFLPKPLQIARIVWHMLPFLKRGIHCLWRGKLKVDVLDALSIGISAFRKDFGTAGTVMFLLELGELLEEWTRKKSMEDLARCMALNVDRVWLKTPESEVLTAVSDIRPGDQIRDSCREYDSHGRHLSRGGSHSQPGFFDRRVCPGRKTPGKHRVCRYGRRRGRVRHWK